MHTRYNEEQNIEKSLKYLEKNLIEHSSDKNIKIIICINGSNDKTKKIIKKIAKNFKFSILVVNSKKGKLRAHKKMLKYVAPEEMIFFMDADVLVPEKTISNIKNQFKKEKNVKIISAYPYILNSQRKKLKNNFLFNVLNIKRIYPKIEVAKNDVSMYHSEKDSFQKKSRIYFHGRFFAIRDKSIYSFPKNNSKIIGDDTFLTRTTLHQYGDKSIKILFGSKVYCAPVLSIK